MRIEKGILKDVNIPGVKFIVDIIPQGRKRRPGIKMNPKYVTIHNTGCDQVPADNFRRVQLDPGQDKEVSWHFSVDEKTIIQHLPITEVAWHAGDTEGNHTSFGIETCERNGAEEVVIKFAAEILKTFNWDTSRVRSHKSWSGKQCPWKILPHWDTFISNIKKASIQKDIALIKAVDKLIAKGIRINAASWNNVANINLKNVPPLIKKMGGIDKLVKNGVISNPVIWNKGTYTVRNIRSLIIKYVSMC